MPVMQEVFPQKFVPMDEIREVTENKLVGIKNVSAEESYFQGHFPGQPVMPGVLILECLAQAAAVLISKATKNNKRVPALVGSDRMRFRRPVVPGDQLILEVELVQWDGTQGQVKGIAKVGDQVAASGDLVIALEED